MSFGNNPLDVLVELHPTIPLYKNTRLKKICQEQSWELDYICHLSVTDFTAVEFHMFPA